MLKRIHKRELTERIREAVLRRTGDQNSVPDVDLMDTDKTHTLLTFACTQRRLDVIRGIFRCTSLTVNTLNRDRETPLGQAASISNNSDIIHELLRWNGIDVNYPSNFKNMLMPPLLIACTLEHEGNVQALLQHSELLL